MSVRVDVALSLALALPRMTPDHAVWGLEGCFRMVRLLRARILKAVCIDVFLYGIRDCSSCKIVQES